MPIVRPFTGIENLKSHRTDEMGFVVPLAVNTSQVIVAPIAGRLSVLESKSGTDKEARSHATVRITNDKTTIDLRSLLIPLDLPSSVQAGDVLGAVTKRLEIFTYEDGQPVPYESFLKARGGYIDVDTALPRPRTQMKIFPLLLVVGAWWFFQGKGR